MSNYKFKISGKEYNVTIGSIEDKIAKVNVNGKDYEVELENQPAAAPAVAAAPAAKPAAGAGVKVTSPLPGVIIEVSVKEGQAVKAGQKVAVIEAMKMENEIAATQDGTISAIHVNKGDSVLEGADIVSIA